VNDKEQAGGQGDRGDNYNAEDCGSARWVHCMQYTVPNAGQRCRV
jgi:hypothetical protein